MNIKDLFNHLNDTEKNELRTMILSELKPRTLNRLLTPISYWVTYNHCSARLRNLLLHCEQEGAYKFIEEIPTTKNIKPCHPLLTFRNVGQKTLEEFIKIRNSK